MTDGCRTICMMPSTAMTTNQTSMTGPNSLPDLRRAAALDQKQPDDNHNRDRDDVGERKSGVATFKPSTAPSTEMAGVMMPSP